MKLAHAQAIIALQNHVRALENAIASWNPGLLGATATLSGYRQQLRTVRAKLSRLQRNPVRSRGPTKATQIKRIKHELDGWRDKLISQQGYSEKHYGNKDAGNSFIHKTIAMYEGQLRALEGK